MASKKKAVAVDTAFRTLMGDKKTLTLTGGFLRSWAQKARDLGGSLSAVRILKAVNKLKVKVIHIRSCAATYLKSNNWFIKFA